MSILDLKLETEGPYIQEMDDINDRLISLINTETDLLAKKILRDKARSYAESLFPKKDISELTIEDIAKAMPSKEDITSSFGGANDDVNKVLVALAFGLATGAAASLAASLREAGAEELTLGEMCLTIYHLGNSEENEDNILSIGEAITLARNSLSLLRDNKQVGEKEPA